MLKFYIIVGIELLFSPFLFAFEEFKKLVGKYRSENPVNIITVRKIDPEIIFAVHEWAGYPFVRQKTIKYVNRTFTCGLKFHFDRFSSYKGKYKLKKILTVSDADTEYMRLLKNQDFYQHDIQICPVDNDAMDFSGYNYIAKNFLDPSREQIVFLTNTSVDSKVVDFIDSYVELFRLQPELGLLGISYSTKIYQTFIKNNFRPHLQSFFLVTSSGILRELLKKNGGNIPGSTESYKLAIIRFGEVKITEMIQRLGYKAAVITEKGKMTTLPDFGTFYNGYYKWKLPMNDYRMTTKKPNMINIITTLAIIFMSLFCVIGCASPNTSSKAGTTVERDDSEQLNVRSFGAKGDGKADDTKALQSALNQGDGQRVFFPKGNYLISKSLVIRSGTEVIGVGDVGSISGSSILTNGSNRAFAIFASDSGELSDVIFRNIRTLRAKYAFSANVKSGFVTKIKWYNCVFQEHDICINVYGSQSNGMYANVFRDCYFKASRIGLYCQGPYNINVIQGCGFENMGDSYIQLSNQSSANLSNSFVQNRCESITNKNGTALNLSNNTFGFYITGNFFENSFRTILKTNGAVNVDFSNNTYTSDHAASGYILINGGSAVIRNNISMTGLVLDINGDGVCTELSANKFLNFSDNVRQENFKRVNNEYNKKFNN